MRLMGVFALVGALGCTATDASSGTRGPADALIEFDVASIDPATPAEDAGIKPRPDTGVIDSGTTPPADASLRCTGTPTPCSLLAKSLCESSLGCVRKTECSGYPGSCYSQFDSYSCTRIKGCYWSSYEKKCSGSATPCSFYSDDFSCTSQRNCTFTDSCTGSALSCESVSIDKCLSQAGCRIE